MTSALTPGELIQFKLQPALDECILHRQRLHQAWLEACTFQPLTAGATSALTEDQVRVLDQLLFRFGRLQDAIGTRLLPALLQLTQEWSDNEPFIDKLNRAEKLGMLPSSEQWQLLRDLRNQTAHEYPAQPELMLANLRKLVDSVPLIEQAHAQLASVAQARMAINRNAT
jgi:hypothetical protein